MSTRVFDNDRYLAEQTEAIIERIGRFDNKLYLEFGGKLLFDMHASRVLPGFEPGAMQDISAFAGETLTNLEVRVAGTEDVEAAKTTTAFFPIDGTSIELVHPLRGGGYHFEIVLHLVRVVLLQVVFQHFAEGDQFAQGLLQIVAVVDPVAVDYETDALVGITTAAGIAPQQVAERLADYPAIVYIV